MLPSSTTKHVGRGEYADRLVTFSAVMCIVAKTFCISEMMLVPSLHALLGKTEFRLVGRNTFRQQKFVFVQHNASRDLISQEALTVED